MQIHDLANIFPQIDGAQMSELIVDIKKNGLLEPITLIDDAIIDGRNRYIACDKAGVSPVYRGVMTIVDGHWKCPVCRGQRPESMITCEECKQVTRMPPIADPVAYVISLNLKRRHLDTSQRAMVATKLAKLGNGQTKGATAIAVAQPDAAQMLNVSVDNVQRARVVQDKGVPELAAMVEQGKVAVSAGAKVARMAPETQRQLVEQGPKAIKAAANPPKPRAEPATVPAPAPAPAPADGFTMLGARVADDNPGVVRQRSVEYAHDTLKEAVNGRRQFPKFLKMCFENKVWEEIRVLIDGTSVKPMPFEQFVRERFPVGLDSDIETVRGLCRPHAEASAALQQVAPEVAPTIRMPDAYEAALARFREGALQELRDEYHLDNQDRYEGPEADFLEAQAVAEEVRQPDFDLRAAGVEQAGAVWARDRFYTISVPAAVAIREAEAAEAKKQKAEARAERAKKAAATREAPRPQ